MFYIYKLANCNYIGSTNNLKERFKGHKFECYTCKRNYHRKVYKYIRENNIKIELIVLAVYKRKCSKKIQRLVEQFWINKFNSKDNGLNTDNAFTNKKKMQKIYNKQFYKNNKEREKKRTKDNYKNNKEYYLQYAANYLQKNREEINKKKRMAYKKNKHKINIKINCPKCGTLISKRHISEHQKTKKCKKLSLKIY